MATQNKNSTVIASEERTKQSHDAPANNKQIASVKKPRNDAPKLRFKEFDGEIFFSKLKPLCNKIMVGIASSATHAYTSDGIPMIRNQNIKENGLDDSDLLFITEEYEKTHKNKRLKKGDILTVRTGYPGLSCIVPDKYENAQCFTSLIIRPDSNQIFSPWLVQYINSPIGKKLMFAFEAGGAQKNINSGSLEHLSVPIFSIKEQQKIANFLTAVDTKLQQLTTKKERLAQYKKGVMQQLFSQQLRFKADDGSAFPDWEEKTLGEIATRNSNKNKEDKVSFVLTNSATQGIVSQQDYFDRDIANKNNLEGYYIVAKDDFIYNPRISVHAPVGPIKRNKLKEGVMSPLYSVFRFNENNLEYFEYFFETIVWHKYLNSVANFGARHDRMNISNADFFKMPIPMPCDKERQKIAIYISAIDLKIEAVQTQLTKTQEFKKGLLQQMFV